MLPDMIHASATTQSLRRRPLQQNTSARTLEAGGEAVRSQCNTNRTFWQTTLKLTRTILLVQFTQSILALGGKLVEMRSVELLASLTGMHPALHPIHVQNSIDCRREKLLNVAVADFLLSTRMPEQTFWLDRRCLACLISKYQK